MKQKLTIATLKKLSLFRNHELPLVFSLLFLLSACVKQKDDLTTSLTVVKPEISLAASADYVAVDELKYDEQALELKWSKPEGAGAGYKTVYLLKMDIADNDYRTAIISDTLQEDVLSKSFTHKQIQSMLIDKWGREAGKDVDLEAKVIAIFQGSEFTPSAIKTVRVKVKPFAPMSILADYIWIQGDALNDAGGVRLTRALENPDLYAFRGELKPGNIVFPLEYNGKKELALAASTPSPNLNDGTATELRHYSAGDMHAAIKIPVKDTFRIVVNRANRTVTVYSPAKDKPIIQRDVYMHGPATPSNWTVANAERLVQSVANPNIWTYSNAAVPLKTGDGRVKFMIARRDGGFTYSASEATTNIEQGIPMTVFAGEAYRNNYYKVTVAGLNYIQLDLEKLTVLFDKR